MVSAYLINQFGVNGQFIREAVISLDGHGIGFIVSMYHIQQFINRKHIYSICALPALK